MFRNMESGRMENSMRGASAAEERAEINHGLDAYLRFFVAGLLKQAQTGGIIPSQRVLISKMISPVPTDYTGRIVELGAGTGALTYRLAARCPDARILACEINPVLARETRKDLCASGLGDRVEMVARPAEHLLAELASRQSEPVDFVISGIPIGNCLREKVEALLDAVVRALAPGGLYIQFQHSLLDRKKIAARFARLRTVPVLLNFPPAVIYYARK